MQLGQLMLCRNVRSLSCCTDSACLTQMIRSMFQALQDPDRLIIAGQNATINPGFHRFGSYISCVHDMVGPTLLV